MTLRDSEGRTLGTALDFAGWCTQPAGHDGPHTTSHDHNYRQHCAAPVALIGDLDNWKPIGILGGIAQPMDGRAEP